MSCAVFFVVCVIHRIALDRYAMLQECMAARMSMCGQLARFIYMWEYVISQFNSIHSATDRPALKMWFLNSILSILRQTGLPCKSELSVPSQSFSSCPVHLVLFVTDRPTLRMWFEYVLVFMMYRPTSKAALRMWFEFVLAFMML